MGGGEADLGVLISLLLFFLLLFFLLLFLFFFLSRSTIQWFEDMHALVERTLTSTLARGIAPCLAARPITRECWLSPPPSAHVRDRAVRQEPPRWSGVCVCVCVCVWRALARLRPVRPSLVRP